MLPHPPESLPLAPSRFYAELRTMLAAVRPRELDRSGHGGVSSARRRGRAPARAVQAVDLIAELLRGQIEIETEYRGAAAIRVRHYLVEPDGRRHELGMTGFLRPALLMFWRATRTGATRVTFDAEG